MKKLMSNLVFTAVLGALVVSCSSTKKATDTNSQRRGVPPSTTELLAQMDSNKDGKLSEAEVKGPLANDFAKVDADGDGFLTKIELDKAPKPGGQRPQGTPPNRGNLIH